MEDASGSNFRRTLTIVVKLDGKRSVSWALIRRNKYTEGPISRVLRWVILCKPKAH